MADLLSWAGNVLVAVAMLLIAFKRVRAGLAVNVITNAVFVANR